MIRPLVLALLAGSALVPAIAHAQALPTGGHVAAGAATIGTPGGAALTITQTSDRAVINWDGFSIGAGGRVTIDQPDAGSALLNRVTGGATSVIAGQLSANGQVYLVNPNGILITRTGSVNAAGFVASTLGLSDDAFMKGDIVVTGQGGSVSNQGAITIVKGGYAALIGGKVDNAGTIVAPLGKVALGAGTRATLDLTGDGFLQVALPAADGGVAMSGRIVADGGAVLLSAAQAVEAARATVNLSGVIEAKGVESKGGTVTLTGGAIMLAGATIDVSGATGGGIVRIGGDQQGGGTLAHAATLTVDSASTIKADATGSGDGGKVVLWSDSKTAFAGTIAATSVGGTGGSAEVSSKGLLDYSGTTDLTGAAFGTLLLDPYNVTISSGTNNTGGSYTANTNDSIINATTLANALALANVVVSTGSGGSEAGDITVTAPISWATAATLTLNAANAITIDAPITVTGSGGVALNYHEATGTDLLASDAGMLMFSGAGSLTFAGTNPSQSLTINGNAYMLLRRIADLYDIAERDLGGHYALAQNLDGTGLGTSAAFAGTYANPFSGTFDGLGHSITNLTMVTNQAYVGLFGVSTGQVRNIGLIGGTVTGVGAVGSLIGYLEGGSVYNAYSSATVTGNRYVGGLIGTSLDSVATGVSASGAVTATGSDPFNIGGLFGQSAGYLSNAYATGAVSAPGARSVGGLVGYGEGTITDAYATGAVSGASQVGGLIGMNNSDLTRVYATGSVAASIVNAGGLVGGSANHLITQAWASGAVTAASRAGGIAGTSIATITETYWDEQSSGLTKGVGSGSATGITGLTNAQARTAAAYTDFDFGTVWYQAGDMRPILRSEAAAPAGGVTTIGSVHQLALMVLDPAGHYQLSHDLDASATASTALSSSVFGVGGFAPVGSSATPFTGTLDGAGYAISGLTITRAATSDVGLIGYAGTGSLIENIGLVGGTITGLDAVGGLVGLLDAGTVLASYSGAAISGRSAVGGLVGRSDGASLTTVYATGSVTGSASDAGGLIGELVSGTVNNAFASGIVSGSDRVGGLIGANSGTVSNVYATGAVIETGSEAGGLIGENGGTVNYSFSTGAVIGSAMIGGEIGATIGSGVSNYGYFDSQTSGIASGGGQPLTTAQLQGTLPAAFNRSLWAIGTGLYPFLKPFFPTGIQAISGFVTAPAGPLAAGLVTLYAGGKMLAGGALSTGTNGYYYGVVPIGTLARTGLTVGATLALAPAAPTNAFILADGQVPSGNLFTLPTLTTGTRTYMTGLTSLSAFEAAFASLEPARAAVFGATTYAALETAFASTAPSILASGAFTIDQAVALTATMRVSTGAGAALAVTAPITLGNGAALVLASSGTLAIDAPIAVTNAGTVALAYNAASPANLVFANNGAIGYGGTATGQALTINGSAYTLLYTLADVDAIDTTDLAGRYALAHDVDATGMVYTDPLVNITALGQFTGTLEGLGHVISNLTIASTGNDVGLIAASSGTVRDIGLVGGNITGGSRVGGLIGSNSGIVTSAYAIGTVSGHDRVGGLIGSNTTSVTNSHASGRVTAADTLAGGLVGTNSGGLATVYSEGAVVADTDGGGLVGANSGTITNAFAMTGVNGTSILGGLVGFNSGTITTAYSTGFVGSGSVIGGLVGQNSGTVTNGYWDMLTGNSTSAAGTGRTTSQLLSVLPTGFSSAVWSTGGGLYPYLTTLFPTGVEAVSGTVKTIAGAAVAGAGVAVYAGGAFVTSILSTGANGFYYRFVPATIATTGVAMGATLMGAGPSSIAGSVTSARLTPLGALFTLPVLLSGARSYDTSATSLSTLAAAGTDEAAIFGPTVAAAIAAQLASAATRITALGAFTIDQSLAVTTDWGIASASGNSLVVAAPITLGNGAALTLASGSRLAINAPITVTNAGSVTLSHSALPTDLTFGNGATIAYTGTSAGQALKINNVAYTLVYSMDELDRIDGIASSTATTGSGTYGPGLAGAYALAQDLDAAGQTYTKGIVGSGSGSTINTSLFFSGIFEGLGHIISNVTIAGGANSATGLFGGNAGTIRDIALFNGSFGNTQSDSGGLVGYNYSNGGLSSGIIVNSYVTGIVSGVTNVGGLVGYDDGGQISNSYATAAVSGTTNVGGLVGTITSSGKITNAYATGAVSGSGNVGGLIGQNGAISISGVYATGPVSGFVNVGGLVGNGGSYSIIGYWDKQTTGQTTSAGYYVYPGAKTTAQLQGTLPLGFDASVWGTGPGLYPYLKSFHP